MPQFVFFNFFMNQNEENPDSSIISQMNIYFTLLRKQTGKCSVPSKIDDEIHKIIHFSIQSSNPITFLQNNGLILFDKCCAINLSLLSKKIISCRSRISQCFRRESWISTFENEKIYKKYLHDILPFNEFKYPAKSTILKSIIQYPQVIRMKQDPIPQVEKKIEDNQFELTLQKDIFSWTVFDDL